MKHCSVVFDIKSVQLYWIQKQPLEHWRCSIKKAVLKNLGKFTRKQLCWSLFLNLNPSCNFIIKSLQHRCFPAYNAKFVRIPLLKSNCSRLFLWIVKSFSCFLLRLLYNHFIYHIYTEHWGRESKLNFIVNLFFFIRKVFIRKWASKTQKFKKKLRKSPVSNAWALIFKNADFSKKFLKVTKFSKYYQFFWFKFFV